MCQCVAPEQEAAPGWDTPMFYVSPNLGHDNTCLVTGYTIAVGVFAADLTVQVEVVRWRV